MNRALSPIIERFRAEEGFTLPELLLAIGILAIVVGPLSLALVTGLRVITRTDQQLGDSRSALIAAASFSGDVASARSVTRNDPSGCGGEAALLTLAWSEADDGRAAPVNSEVSYVYDASNAQNKRLLRLYCPEGTAAKQSVAAVSLGSSPVVTCYDIGNVVNPSCSSTTRRVRLDVTAAANQPTPDDPSPTPFSFTLEGTRRSR